MVGVRSLSYLPLLGLVGSALNGVHASVQAPPRDLCPETCLEAGNSPSNWTVVGEIGQLKACSRPVILELDVRAPLSQRQHIRTCNVFSNGFKPSQNISSPAADDLQEEEVTPQLAWTPASSDSEIAGRLAPQSLEHLKLYLEHSDDATGLTILFGTNSDTTVGVFVGAELLQTSVTQELFPRLTELLNSAGLADSKSALLQLCEGRSQEHMFGLIAAASSEFDTVHHAVRQWANGTCVDTSSYAETLQVNATTITSIRPPLPPVEDSPPSNSTASSIDGAVSGRGLLSHRQSTCQTVTVISGNDCGMLLTKCRTVTNKPSMTAQQFYSFNPQPNLCSTLQAGQKVCCSTGALPGNPEPEGNADGTCKTVTVIQNNDCGMLVTKCRTITGQDVTAQTFYKFNPDPNLCSTLKAGQKVCCSKGKLPVPVDPEGNADGTCKTVTVAPNNLCGDLVSKCGRGINLEQLEKFNPTTRFCNTLQEGQRVCCTKGKLADIRPKIRPDGTCVPYQIQLGEYCSTIAVRNGLTVDELKSINKDTWGWNGCDYGFWTGNWLCLSPGVPPFPAPISNAVCGPQKPGSTRPAGSNSRSWASMNPCPLKACCNTWGQCGTTADFCIDTNTGPPGTAKKDTYGCISNCGMDPIIGAPPQRFIKLGYFEGWNLGRGCLNMDVGQIDPSYTHVHFAFGMIRRHTYEIYHESVHAEYQFNQFKHLRFQKRIISFGGWVFSAEAPNYPVFREGVRTEASRETLANNLVKFVMDHNLDGLDLDWEYPSAPDLPDIPAGDLSEAGNYLKLIELLRKKLPSSKSLSIAAPASYWYLKQFDIEAMARHLDYIVYMTYDLHGQWDAGNKWASPGCPTGNCLRSHVNMTETFNALTMITRAGVPSNKVLVGVTSYGRSFQMSDPSCTGPNCFFTGDRFNSNARKGRCTDTAGYISNAEIDEMAARGGRSFLDVTQSDIYVDGDLWVSYMKDDNKRTRTARYVGMNMGGTIDWAVDLQKFYQPPTSGWDSRGNLISNVRVSWPQLKAQIDAGDRIGCDKRVKTGSWMGKDCDKEPTTRDLNYYTPKERWEALDCNSAWTDTKNMWFQCEHGTNTSTFSNTINKWLGGAGNTNCDDTSDATKCTEIKDCWDRQPPEYTGNDRVGACAFDIWNSFVELHTRIKNFHGSLRNVENTLSSNGESFIKAFTPDRDDQDKFLELLFGFLTIPLGLAMGKLFGGSLMESAFFSGDAGGAKAEALEAALTNLVDVGMGVWQEEVKSANKEEGLSYQEIIEATVKSWRKQVDRLIVTIFNGERETVDALGEIFKDGKLVDGKRSPRGSKLKARQDGQTDSWGREKAIERAYYAIAIPAIWASRHPTPVIVDFGQSCQIDARGYFHHGPAAYNQGWRCINGRSYILAGAVDGPAKPCGDSWPGNTDPCPDPGEQKPLTILSGIENIQRRDNEWGEITVDDLIRGAVNTWRASGETNKLDEEREGFPGSGDVQTGNLDGILDVSKAGHIRIPVCDAEEVSRNWRKGRALYGDSANWPCDA